MTSINIMLLILLFSSHFLILSELVRWIPCEGAKSVEYNYPFIRIRLYWPPPMYGEAGGASIFDVTLVLIGVALIINIVFVVVFLKSEKKQHSQ